MEPTVRRSVRRTGRHRRLTRKTRYAAASAALVGASVIASTPVPAPPPQPRAASAEVRLAAASSLLNVPINMLIDMINIPYNEVRATDYTARAFLFSGPWFVVGPTNVWGVDQGDPMKFMSLVNMLVPFPALSGMDRDQFDQNGLGQQFWFYVATQLPTSDFCDDQGCMPTVLAAPVTGIASIDSLIWGIAVATGQVKFPLFDNWFKVPISEVTTGFTFGPNWPGRVSPAGQIFPGLGFVGTKTDPVTGQPIVPWDGMKFTLDLNKPFTSYVNHLMADPATNPIQLPTLEQVGRAIQSLAAALVVAFWPITPGSVFCPGDCADLPPAMNYPNIVKTIGNLWPGNESINEWLAAYKNGTANVPTPEQIQLAVKFKTSQFWSFTNPSLPDDWAKGFNLSSLAPAFHALWTALGLNPPPLQAPVQQPNGDATDPTGSATEVAASQRMSAVKASEPAVLDSATTQPATTQPATTESTPREDAAPVAAESQPANNETTPAQQQNISSVTTPVSEAPATAAAAPDESNPIDGQTPSTDTSTAGKMEAPSDPDSAGGAGETKTDTPNTGSAGTTNSSAAGTSNSGGASTGGRHRAA